MLEFILLNRLAGKVKVTQSCPTLRDPMDYTVHRISQVTILEWVAFPFSRGYFRPREQTQVSCIAGRFFTSWATRESQEHWVAYPFSSGSSWPRNQTGVSGIAGRFFINSVTREAIAGKTNTKVVSSLHQESIDVI